MTTNLFVTANVKQLRTDSSFRILLSFFRTSLGVGFLNSAIFNSFHNRVEFGTILEGLRNFGGGLNPPNPPPGKPLLLSIGLYCSVCPNQLSRSSHSSAKGATELRHVCIGQHNSHAGRITADLYENPVDEIKNVTIEQKYRAVYTKA